MTKYLILYRSDVSASQTMAEATPDKMKTEMERWIKWRDDMTAKGLKIDFGMPLQIANKVTKGGVEAGSSDIGGYAFLEGDKDVILDALKTHPQLDRLGASIDMLEVLPMPGIDA